MTFPLYRDTYPTRSVAWQQHRSCVNLRAISMRHSDGPPLSAWLDTPTAATATPTHCDAPPACIRNVQKQQLLAPHRGKARPPRHPSPPLPYVPIRALSSLASHHQPALAAASAVRSSTENAPPASPQLRDSTGWPRSRAGRPRPSRRGPSHLDCYGPTVRLQGCLTLEVHLQHAPSRRGRRRHRRDAPNGRPAADSSMKPHTTKSLFDDAPHNQVGY